MNHLGMGGSMDGSDDDHMLKSNFKKPNKISF